MTMSRRNIRAAAARTLPRPLALATLLILAAFGAGGCESSAATAALGTAIGVGVGVPLATRSKVEVRVDVFNQHGLGHEDAKFIDDNSPLAREVRDCLWKRRRAGQPLGLPLDPSTEAPGLAD